MNDAIAELRACCAGHCGVWARIGSRSQYADEDPDDARRRTADTVDRLRVAARDHHAQLRADEQAEDLPEDRAREHDDETQQQQPLRRRPRTT